MEPGSPHSLTPERPALWPIALPELPTWANGATWM